MSRKPATHRVDSNQADIVKALVAKGYSVKSLTAVGDGCPDLLVGVHGLNILLEVKMSKRKLRVKQEGFRQAWKGQCATVTSPEDAVSIVDLIVKANWRHSRDSNGQERPVKPHDGKSYDEHQISR